MFQSDILIETIAQKSASQEDEADICYEKVVAQESDYLVRLADLTKLLPSGMSLAELNAIEKNKNTLTNDRGNFDQSITTGR